ncbi:hypothetical protein DFR49_4008 [Hephaestia caeni]|uniref:DUF4350 domain-containing protein n=1 Tax=Hephaestia caeni TaxID=645617 RepID=A0A397NM97_9SPHN|nr:hypothetical protein [Hephaestia caeni]RIA36723.1 hypothetical protein DFR49_4008 [Hephaestia caeni]
MSDLAIGRHDTDDAIFAPRTVTLMLIVGVIGFVGALVLGAYTPDLRQADNGGEHALSRSAVGFAGIVRLASATGRNPHIIRRDSDWSDADLVIATPERAAVPVGGLTQTRLYKTTLMILPKWQTVEDERHSGWVRIKGLLPINEPEGVLAPAENFSMRRRGKGGQPLVNAPGVPDAIAFTAPRETQVIVDYKRAEGVDADADSEEGDDGEEGAAPPPFIPLITDGQGGTVLGRLGNLYILADPDLLDNAGMKEARNAASALALLDWINGEDATSIGFDVTLNGLGGSRSPLTLAFDPPFLAMTLALAAAALLLGWRARGRFGAPRPRDRAIAFGTRALVDNSAALVRKAGRARRLGGRYAAVIREQAVRGFGLSPRLKGPAIDAYLDDLGGETRFSDLASAAEGAEDNATMLAAARALHQWQRERLGDD